MDIQRLIRPAAFVLFGAISCLLFYRPNSMKVDPPLDDVFYLHKTQVILGEKPIEMPRMGWAIGSFVAPGTSWIWVYPAFLAKAVAVARHENVQDWTWAVLSIFGFVTWVACFPLTVKLLETFPAFAALGTRTRFLYGLFVFLNLPLVSNAVGHPLSSHIYETFFALLMVIWLRRGRLVIAAMACTAMTMIRYNDAPAFLMIAGAWLDKGRPLPKTRTQWWGLGAITVGALLAVWHVAIVAFVRGYGAQTMQEHFRDISWLNVKLFFFHWGHGVVFTYCLWFAALLLGLALPARLSWAARGGWVWMALHVLLYAFWGGPGASMGHRYLCGTMAAAIVIFGELFLVKEPTSLTPWLMRMLGVAGAWLTFLMLTFCTCQQLNYSVEFEMKDRPGIVFHPYYFDRLRDVILIPRLYGHVLELGLVGSLLETKFDPDFNYHGEAILPAGSIAITAGTWTLIGALFAAVASIFSLRENRE